jgi:hypothetical protein
MDHGKHGIDLLLIGNFPPFSFIKLNLIAGTLIAQQKFEVNLTKKGPVSFFISRLSMLLKFFEFDAIIFITTSKSLIQHKPWRSKL